MTASRSARTRIALCIDDFGLHPGVNEATLRLLAQSRVTAVSCMTGAPHWREGAARLKAAATDGVDIGLHLDFTEYPLSSGLRFPLPVLAARASLRLLPRERLREEIHAQLDAFEEALGRSPAHVDGHQHVHQFPVVRELLLEALLARYPLERPWLRATRSPPGMASGGFKARVIERLGCERLSALARAQGHPQNSRLLGVYDFEGDAQRFLGLLTQWLDAATTGDLLMCHAGLSWETPDAIAAARQREYQILASDAFPAALARAGVELAVMSRLLRAAEA